MLRFFFPTNFVVIVRLQSEAMNNHGGPISINAPISCPTFSIPSLSLHHKKHYCKLNVLVNITKQRKTKQQSI